MIQRMKNMPIAGEFLRFIVVGVLSTIVNYGVFYVLLRGFDVSYLIASAAGFLSGVGVGYRLNKSWTYAHQGRSSLALTMKYLAIYAVSLALGLAFLAELVNSLGLDARLANVLTIGLTTMTNFIGTKFWVFRKTK